MFSRKLITQAVEMLPALHLPGDNTGPRRQNRVAATLIY
jgi:hypothetical protein